MKKIFFLFMLVLGAGMTYAQGVTASAGKEESTAAFNWDEQTFDFGRISRGTPVTHEFEFTNNGSAPLLIMGVKPSCGCTTPEWTKEPIPAGSAGFIKATYNAATPGVFSKTITVTSNVSGNPVVLTIKGEVE